MRFRRKETEDTLQRRSFTSMIDVVFLLLIFFMLALHIVEPEGDFTIQTPGGIAPGPTVDPFPHGIKVRLIADANGRLQSLELGRRKLGSGAEAFTRLNNEILKLIGRPGNPLTKDIEVEIDADYNLNYENIIKAVGACSGRLGERGQIVRYVEKIKFAPPRRPAAGGA